MTSLTVIVPSYNSRATIKKCLEAIRISAYGDYELIVVDDHSSDGADEIADALADTVIRLDNNWGSGYARKMGIDHARAEILCFVDSDIVIRPNTTSMIMDFFNQHPETDAITGLLSAEHSNQDFFSQYKNLYMHYIFKCLPERVTFLFGSICAIRKGAITSAFDFNMRYTPDTEFGQQLFLRGKRIIFLKDLEVTHLKQYTLRSLVLNDFKVPFSWARLFIRFGGWRQLGRHGTGFAHASLLQLLSVGLVTVIVGLSVVAIFGCVIKAWLYFLLLIWFVLNTGLLFFLYQRKGFIFVLKGIGLTFADQLTMAAGIFFGLCFEILRPQKKACFK